MGGYSMCALHLALGISGISVGVCFHDEEYMSALGLRKSEYDIFWIFQAHFVHAHQTGTSLFFSCHLDYAVGLLVEGKRWMMC